MISLQTILTLCPTFTSREIRRWFHIEND